MKRTGSSLMLFLVLAGLATCVPCYSQTVYGVVAPSGSTDLFIFAIPFGEVKAKFRVSIAARGFESYISITPDGRYGVVAPAASTNLFIFEIPSGEVKATVSVATALPAKSSPVSITPDGKYGLVAAAGSADLLIFEIPSGQVKAKFPVSNAAREFESYISITPDGKYGLVAAGASTYLYIFEIPSGTVTARISKSSMLHEKSSRISITPDGRYGTVAPTGSAELLVFEIPSGKLLKELPAGAVARPESDHVVLVGTAAPVLPPPPEVTVVTVDSGPPATCFHAMWTHGSGVQVENPESLVSVTRLRYCTSVVGKPNAGGWFHFAIPTPVIGTCYSKAAGQEVAFRYRILRALIYIHTSGPDVRITQVHVWDGNQRRAQYDDLTITGGPLMRAFDVPGKPEVIYGIGISIRVEFGPTGGWVSFIGAGGDFLVSDNCSCK